MGRYNRFEFWDEGRSLGCSVFWNGPKRGMFGHSAPNIQMCSWFHLKVVPKKESFFSSGKISYFSVSFNKCLAIFNLTGMFGPFFFPETTCEGRSVTWRYLSFNKLTTPAVCNRHSGMASELPCGVHHWQILMMLNVYSFLTSISLYPENIGFFSSIVFSPLDCWF